jgi:hypothetical protein
MFYMGLDLGQRRDHTAVAVVEKEDEHPLYAGLRPERLVVRHLQRAPLGTGYPAVVEAVREAVWSDELQGRCALAVDATGLGAPVVDMLKAARLGCDLAAVTITSGEKETQQGMYFSVPKRDLIGGLQVRLEAGELRIARGIEGVGALVRELMNMRRRDRGGGRVRVGADGFGEHDDLVVALALAVWRARPKPKVRFGDRRLI